MQKQTDAVVGQNVRMYDSYYLKPDWWFQFRYDTQVKRKTFLHLYKKVKGNRSLTNQKVLEIGFGSGAVLFSFDTTCELAGVEISHSAVERATRKAEEKGYRAFDFKIVNDESLPYQDESFHVVFASHVIEHVENDKKLLEEIRRVLRPDGMAIVLIPINENYEDPNHLQRYTSSDFKKLSENSSFEVRYPLENELLFHFVEKFYFEEYNYRWKILGPLIAMLFNFPTSILPFGAYQIIDRIMKSLGWLPRQFGCVLLKQSGKLQG
jgi:ubiquinone/menaquinone biosynthesis C-methylase UbiE